jgi:predicted membrane-bound spermidine synthase
MLVVLVPLFVCVLGALVYAFAANPKLGMLGLIAFAVGLFWTVRCVYATDLHLFTEHISGARADATLTQWTPSYTSTYVPMATSRP